MSEFENDAIVRAAKGEKEALYDLQLEVSPSVQWIFFAGKTVFEENYADEPELEELQPVARTAVTASVAPVSNARREGAISVMFVMSSRYRPGVPPPRLPR